MTQQKNERVMTNEGDVLLGNVGSRKSSFSAESWKSWFSVKFILN
jgi:hypothetical protein